MKKSLLLIFALLLSFSSFASDELEPEQIVMDKGTFRLGYLEGDMGMPLHKELTLVRTEDTPKKVVFTFFFTQVEMICAERIPDAFTYVEGGSRTSTNTNGNRTTNKRRGYGRHNFGGGYGHGYGRGYGYGYGHGHGGNTYNYYGPDRNFLGICKRWTEMETEKMGRVGVFFKKKMKSPEETLTVSIVRRDRHTTSFFFDADMVTPSRKYKKKRMNSRAVMFR